MGISPFCLAGQEEHPGLATLMDPETEYI